MKKTNSFPIIKLILISLLLTGYSQWTFSQLVVTDQAAFFVDTNGIVEIKGNVIIENGGTLSMNGQEIIVEGDLMQNGSFPNPLGILKFTGIDTQTISGNLEAANAIFDLVIEQQDESSHVDLQTNVEVMNTLEFASGKIITNANEVYLKNEAANAIIGHFVPNITDGTYASNDRFVEGKLSRNVAPSTSTTYLFPIGSSGDFYNPVQIENLSGNAGKISASFSSENLGPINFTGTVDCSVSNPAYAGTASNVVQSNNLNTDLEYTNMTSQGVWDISSVSSYDYDLVAYPNAANTDVNPPATGQYHLLKRPSGDDPSSDWTPFALTGNPCVNSSNYFELVGTGFSDFSIFGIAGAESGILPVELIDFYARVIHNKFVKLKWTTGSEMNNLGFEIERSSDGKAFEKIGWKDGFRDFESERNYVFDDKNVFKNELYYYRLKQVDVDGTFEFSEIVTAKILGIASIEISPNPTYDEIIVTVSNDLKNDPLSIEIFDVLGRLVFYKTAAFKSENSFQFSFQNSNFSKGVYFLKIKNLNQEVASKKLIFN